MLTNFIFSLNAVLPTFLVILTGWALKRKNIIDSSFITSGNNICFKLALPILLFINIYNSDIRAAFDVGLLSFAVIATIATFLISWGAAELLVKDKAIIGTLVQGSFRSNYALIGLVLISNIMGAADTAKSSLITCFIIPLYNVLAIVVLTARSSSRVKTRPADILRQIVRNPLIIGILLGVPFSYFQVRLPHVIYKALESFALLATPLALLGIGGSISFAGQGAKMKLAAITAAVKLLWPVLLLPIAVMLGFTGENIVVLLVLFGAPTAVSSFTMAKYMGGDEYIASNTVMLSTLFSAVTFTLAVYALKTLALL